MPSSPKDGVDTIHFVPLGEPAAIDHTWSFGAGHGAPESDPGGHFGQGNP